MRLISVNVLRILLLVAAVVAVVLWAPAWVGPLLTFSILIYGLLKAWFPEQVARWSQKRRRRRGDEWGGPGDRLL